MLVASQTKKIQHSIDTLKTRKKAWDSSQKSAVAELTKAIADLEHLDIDAEIEAHKCHDSYKKKKAVIDEAKRWISSIETDDAKQTKVIEKLDKEIALLKDHTCYACGQDMHDAKQEEILKAKEDQKQEAALQIISNASQMQEHADTIASVGELEECPITFYSTIDDAYNHRSTVDGLVKELSLKEAETNPYTAQIEDLERTALQEISYDNLNALTTYKEHQDFLLKLLTNKDSFIRKKIIDQNLAYLNSRLTYFLDKLGLPHQVQFMNDLSVEITQLGQDLDFDNLSRGERNRLILGLSWAFRNVWENLYNNINLLFIDELIDNGLDSAGVENALGILKKMGRDQSKNVYLISHKDELVGRVNNVLKVTKENGFTSYENATDYYE